VQEKKVLVIDEPGFSRVCSALLEMDGFVSHTLADRGDDGRAEERYDLIITSYPYGAGFFSWLAEHNIPVLVLADCVSRELIQHVKYLKNTRCLIKPIDFDELGTQVRRMLGQKHSSGEDYGFEII
jgi:DNA-binding response OmpR family regulator